MEGSRNRTIHSPFDRAQQADEQEYAKKKKILRKALGQVMAI